MIEKIILELIDPLLISIILLLFSFYYFIKNKNIYFFTASLIFLYLINTSFITETLLFNYERQFPKIDLNEVNRNHTVFVFGGGAYNKNDLPVSSKPSDASSIRLLESLTLLNSKSTLILSGRNIINGVSESKLLYNLTKKINPSIKIKIDENSTNTEQQIKYISELKYTQIILVSSASHIPRINYLANKFNINNYLLAPTAFKVRELDFEIYDYLPSSKGSYAMKQLFYELFAFSYTWLFV